MEINFNLLFNLFRLKKAREEEEGGGGPTSRAAVRQELQRRLGTMAVVASQVGGSRPLTFCHFSNDSQMLVTASWYVEFCLILKLYAYSIN